MRREILGLDIGDDFIAAVVVQSGGSDRRITAFGTVRTDEGRPLHEMLPGLLDQVGWKGGRCVCGISLARISLRNLTVPFLERRKIDQVLPLELEDQLLVSVGDQVVEYVTTGTGNGSSTLLIAGVEKERMRRLINDLQLSGILPVSISPRNMAIAEVLIKSGKQPSSFLVLDAGMHCLNLALAQNGRVVFLRRLPYPERMFTRVPFSFRNGLASIADQDEAAQCIAALSEDIQRTIGFLRSNGLGDFAPEQVVMSGGMGQVAQFREMLQQHIGWTVVAGNVREEAGVKLDAGVGGQWEPALLDHALALALRGLQKRGAMNFRKGEFAPDKLLFATRGQLAAALSVVAFAFAAFIGWLVFDYHSLNSKYEAAGAKMNALYRETFPESTRIVDPLAQMQSNLRGVQAPSIATPVFAGEKRVLNILADISGRIPESIEIRVSRLVIDQDSVQIKGTTDTFNNVNLIEGSLRESPLFQEVRIVSAAADKESGKIRFELRLQTGGIS